ncbi:hypothetical protein GWK47_013479 [Chionoecetes opilio]|uniref:Uncharacterized protein n=1 Tax=Chionoecetes opilio TaxID=41210 RepID=A0A8J4XXW6_CHIOP|nr:hypothetical protein GWK47_013479 [Chionoecetes opilio]
MLDGCFGRHFGDTWRHQGWTTRINSSRALRRWPAKHLSLAAHNLTKTRHRHQVSALRTGQRCSGNAHQEAVGETTKHVMKVFEAMELQRDMAARSSNIPLLGTILRLEFLACIFVRAHRQNKSSPLILCRH